MGISRVAWVFVVAIAACEAEAPVGSSPSSAVAPPTATPTPAASTLPAEPESVTISSAMFSKQVLDACVDWTISGYEKAGLEKFKALNLSEDEGKGDVSSVKLKKPCPDQFSDRSALATCRTVEENITRTERYYDTEPLTRSDSRMRRCLKNGGEWDAVARDSEAWLNAKQQQLMRDMEKHSK